MDTEENAAMTESNPDSTSLQGRPYFPCCLQNGTDSILVGMLGSPDGTWQYSVHLSRQCAVGWYKTGRRENRVDCSLIELANLSVHPFIGREAIVIADFHQAFDARTATLTTEYHQFDNRAHGRLRVRVTTFLTRDHLLVERYELLEVPPNGASFRFAIGPAAQPEVAQLPGASFTRPVIGYQLTEGPMATGVGFSWLSGYSSGCGCTWTDLPGTRPVGGWGAAWRFNGAKGGIEVATPEMTHPTRFTRYSCVVDERDADGRPVAACLRDIADKVDRLGYEGIRAEHVAAWRGFFAASSIVLPTRPDIQYAYDFTRYYLAGCQEERSGFTPVGLQPFLWQGYQFWDWHFMLLGWLEGNHLTHARHACEFILSCHSRARKLAALMGCRGARLAWRTCIEEFEAYPERNLQFHNNSVAAYALYAFFRATGDREFLGACFDLMDDLLLFMADRVILDRGEDAVIRECMSPDESPFDLKVNDTWTCAITLRALEGLQSAATLLGRTPRTPSPGILAAKLRRRLDRNVDAAGVLQSFEGGTRPHWGSLIFAHLPGHPALRTTIDALLRNYDPALGVYNTHAVSRYAEKSFPWTDFWVARILAEAGDPKAGDLIAGQLRHSNGFGGLAERIFYDGRLYKEYTATVHAVFAWALLGCMAVQVGDMLSLFPGVPAAWGHVSFCNLRTSEGLLVSAERADGRVVSLRVENPHGASALRVRLPGGKEFQVRLAPGANELPIAENTNPSGTSRHG